MTIDYGAGADDDTKAGDDAGSDEAAPKPHPEYDDKEWCYMSQTSMATALVAGCAAVLRETPWIPIIFSSLRTFYSS